MSNRPNQKPSRSTGATGSGGNRIPSSWSADEPSGGGRRIGIIVGAVVLALVLAGGLFLVLRRGSGEPELSAQAAKGKQVATSKGCISCHTSTGDVSEGPTWKGLAGSKVTLTDGTTVVADTSYLTKAIRDPKAEIVQGYKATMPATPVTDEELAALLAYLEALR